ncbi:MAG: hypothetical protein WD492_12940 [Alkalispirochaeta sp.]
MIAELDIPGSSGRPLRPELELISDQSGGRIRDPRLDVRPPGEGLHAWEAFWSVWNGQRVEYSELEAYSRLTRDELEPWEVDAIRRMDGAVSQVIADRTRGSHE